MTEVDTYSAQVSEVVFKEVLSELLFPLFPGTEFAEVADLQPPARNRDRLVTQVGGGTDYKLMPHADSEVCVQIHRAQVFERDEKAVISQFLNSVGRAYRDWDEPYVRDTSASVMSGVVAGSIAPHAADLMGRIVSQLISWGQQTYEGDRIAFSIGLELEATDSGVELDSVEEEDFLKVLSNGQDTLVVINRSGHIVRHETLIPPENHDGLMAPVRMGGVAKWTQERASRSVVTLNRNGEILAFRSGKLLFARRRGDWRYFAHESVMKCFVKNAMASSSPMELRKEIYRTSLDSAFARAGACIGVMNASRRSAGLDALISPDDLLNHANPSPRAKAFRALIGDAKFQELDRQLRLELVSVDGATVLDHQGTILAVGAILKIGDRGAGGGGREAASIALAKYGLGLKISNDGYIRARNRDEEVVVQLA